MSSLDNRFRSNRVFCLCYFCIEKMKLKKSDPFIKAFVKLVVNEFGRNFAYECAKYIAEELNRLYHKDNKKDTDDKKESSEKKEEKKENGI